MSGSSYVGGLVGYSGGTISNSFAIGSVTGSTYVGGLAGENDGTISKSYATGSVSGTGTFQSIRRMAASHWSPP